MGRCSSDGSVVGAAFPTPTWSSEPMEVGLLDRLREGPGWHPRFALVAVAGTGEVVGHVVATRGDVDGHPALGLGPLAVRPDRQGRGVGTLLVHALVAAAEPARGASFQVRPLVGHTPRGTFRYAAPFAEV